ncbi:MAG: hypothetical protein D6713_10075 [Deltaproteobacteria bacterium]|nr:MAG: hypothetical protein D6713_10075 [Deltaproteobacteria bacterium]
MDKFSLDVEYSGKRDLSLSGTLRHTRKLATDLNLSLSFLPFRWLRYSGWINYSIKDNVIIENTSYLEYIPSSRCWSVTLGASRKTKPPETTYSLFFTLRGIGSLGR